MTEYEIKPLSLRCVVTSRELKAGEVYYSALVETPEGFSRVDYSAEAWTGPPETAVGFWRSKVPPETASTRPRPVDDSVLMQFFERLAQDPTPERQSFRYILTLLLVRRRVLKLSGSVRDGSQDWLLVRVAQTGEEHRVLDPGLNEEQLAAVEAQVEQILQNPTG